MMSLLKCEYKKTRGRYILITAIVITVLELCWVLYGDYDADSIEKGWMAFLYQLPLINEIFMPILAIVVASRLCDIEHKGSMLKLICCMTEKKKLYDAKLIYGISVIAVCFVIQYAAVIVFGFIKGLGGVFPVKSYLLCALFTFVPTIEIYIVQHTLSFLFKNQAISFFAGVIGEFLGLFSMFLPQLPLLRKLIIWGHYGALQFVGLNWDRETRISDFYYFDLDWAFFTAVVIVTIVLYFAGRKLFTLKEV